MSHKKHIDPDITAIIYMIRLPYQKTRTCNTYNALCDFLQDATDQFKQMTMEELLDTDKPKPTGIILTNMILNSPKEIKNYASLKNRLLDRYGKHHVLEIRTLVNVNKYLTDIMQSHKEDILDILKHQIEILKPYKTIIEANTEKSYNPALIITNDENRELPHDVKTDIDTFLTACEKRLTEWDEIYANIITENNFTKCTNYEDVKNDPSPELRILGSQKTIQMAIQEYFSKNTPHANLNQYFNIWQPDITDYITNKIRYNPYTPVKHACRYNAVFPAKNGVFTQNHKHHKEIEKEYIPRPDIDLNKNCSHGLIGRYMNAFTSLLGNSYEDEFKLAAIIKSCIMPADSAGTVLSIVGEKHETVLFTETIKRLQNSHHVNVKNETEFLERFGYSTNITVVFLTENAIISQHNACNQIFIHTSKEPLPEMPNMYQITLQPRTEKEVIYYDLNQTITSEIAFLEDVMLWTYNTCTSKGKTDPCGIRQLTEK